MARQIKFITEFKKQNLLAEKRQPIRIKFCTPCCLTNMWKTCELQADMDLKSRLTIYIQAVEINLNNRIRYHTAKFKRFRLNELK